MTIPKKIPIAIGTLTLLIASFPAIAEIRQQRVNFQPGTNSTNIRGQIRGYESIDYILNARAGQSANFSLGTDNPQNYFNVIPPSESDTGVALFTGSISGNQYEGILPENGDYRIRVYLMRAAARRGEVANYVLDMAIGNSNLSRNSNSTGPYSTDNYDATTIFDCEVRNLSDLREITHGQSCPAGILRGDRGSASIRIQLPNGGERVLNFDNGNVTTPDGGNLNWGKDGDTWFIGIDGSEFFIIPEAAVNGG